MMGELLSVLACTAFLGFFLIVFGFFAFWRYLQYRELVILAEKGLVRPAPATGNGSGTLRWGIVITALGLALSLGFYPFGFMIDAPGRFFPLHFGPWMLIGLVPLFFGLALVLIHMVTRENKPKGIADKALAHESRVVLDPELEGDKGSQSPNAQSGGSTTAKE